MGRDTLQQEGAYAGCIDDLKLLESRALATKDIALLVESRLGQSAAAGVSYLPAELLASLVQVGTPEGRWSIERALLYVSLMPEARRNAALGSFAALGDDDVLASVYEYVSELQDPEERGRLRGSRQGNR